MKSYWVEDLAITIATLFVFAAASFIAIVVPIDFWARYVCSAYEDRTGVETRYQTFDTCYVRHKEEWLRYSAYEKVIIARDGLSELE